jgi:hypothetical protein
MLAEQILPLGAPEHGTSTWQEGEIAEQPVGLPIPEDAVAGIATVGVELLGPDGQALKFEGARSEIRLADVEIAR